MNSIPNAVPSSSSLRTPSKPWYREPWPWLLMSGPLLVVIASFVSAWLAVKTDDGLVTDDYYRQGLAIHRTLLLSDQAKAWGLTAGVRVVDGQIRIHLRAADRQFVAPSVLLATLSHPTRAGLDQSVKLSLHGDGYAGDVRLPAAGHWLLLLEDEQKTWRLLGNVVLPANGEILLGATTTAH